MIAYSGLPPEVKGVDEKTPKTRAGNQRLLAATTTVAAATVSALMDVAVLLFIFGRLTYFLDLNIEVQTLPGEFVVAVNFDLFVIGFQNLQGHGTIRRLGVEHHAWFNGLFLGELSAWKLADQLFAALAISLFRGHNNREAFTDFLAFKSFLQTGHDILMPVKIREGSTVLCGGVKHLALIVTERVFDRYDLVFGDFHDPRLAHHEIGRNP